MVELLNQWLPNVMDRPDDFYQEHSGNPLSWWAGQELYHLWLVYFWEF